DEHTHRAVVFADHVGAAAQAQLGAEYRLEESERDVVVTERLALGGATRGDLGVFSAGRCRGSNKQRAEQKDEKGSHDTATALNRQGCCDLSRTSGSCLGGRGEPRGARLQRADTVGEAALGIFHGSAAGALRPRSSGSVGGRLQPQRIVVVEN